MRLICVFVLQAADALVFLGEWKFVPKIITRDGIILVCKYVAEFEGRDFWESNFFLDISVTKQLISLGISRCEGIP